MLSAPAAIPATRHATFSSAFTPHGLLMLTCSRTRPASPAFSARAITGTRPARDTRFGSSNDACVFPRSCDNRTCEVSSPARRRKRKELPSSQLRGHLSRRRALTDTHYAVDSSLGERVSAEVADDHQVGGLGIPDAVYIHLTGDSLPPGRTTIQAGTPQSLTASSPSTGKTTASSESRSSMPAAPVPRPHR